MTTPFPAAGDLFESAPAALCLVDAVGDGETRQPGVACAMRGGLLRAPRCRPCSPVWMRRGATCRRRGCPYAPKYIWAPANSER